MQQSSAAADTLTTEQIAPRKNIPSLLQRLSSRPPELLHYLGTSFGITQQLFSFWQRAGYRPVYVRQVANDLTGEFTTVMLRTLREDAESEVAQNWLSAFVTDFHRRLVSLLGSAFRSFTPSLALSLLQRDPTDTPIPPLTKAEMDYELTPFDMKRLEGYAHNLVDYHVVWDLVPVVARQFFKGRISVNLSALQSAILLATGLQMRTLDDIAAELTVQPSQVMALFNKTILKISQHLRSIQESAVAETLPEATKLATGGVPVPMTLDQDLTSAATEAADEMRHKQAIALSDPELQQYVHLCRHSD